MLMFDFLYLALEGFENLKVVFKMVPKSFTNERESYITRIVNGLLDDVISPSNYQNLC